MKNIIYILSFLFFFSCNDSNQVKNDLTELNLNGEVKSFIEFSYPKLSTNWNYKDVEFHFDQNGHLNKKIDYDYNTYTILSYDIENGIKNGKQFSLNDSLMFKGLYEYENQQLKRKQVLNLENEVIFTVKYTYSNNGNGITSIEEKEFDQNNNLLKHSSILRNTKKQDIAWHEFDLEGKLLFKHSYNYNDKGNRIEYIKRDSLEKLKWRVQTKYNTENLETERILYNPVLDKETIQITTYEFDDEKNWIVKWSI